MNEKIFSGYLLKGVSSVADLETTIDQMKKSVNDRASIAYQALLKWQIEKITDEIALNQIQRPNNQSILDVAANEVRRRITYSGNVLNETEFDLYIGVQIMQVNINGTPSVLLKVISPNDIYSKGFKKIDTLIPYDIYSDDLNRKCEKHETWDKICEKYGHEISLISNLINYDSLTAHPEKFIYRSPKERAHDMAAEKIFNHLLSAYACEQEIPPMKIAEYSTAVFNRMNYQLVKDEIALEEERLTEILPKIDFGIVSTIGILHSDTDLSKVEQNACKTEADCGCGCGTPEDVTSE